MAEVDIPSYFLCPISLQIMRDPVTLPTGITYDRDSIERWMFDEKHKTCPVTKQQLPDCDLTPNHTLRRLIQAWCVVNSSNDVERFPTPKPPIDEAQIAKLLDDACRLPHLQLGPLRKLKEFVAESERNRRCVEATPGVVDILASIINNNSSGSTSAEKGILNIGDDDAESTNARDEALSILYLLRLSERNLLDLAVGNGDFIESLTSILQQSNYQTRAYATLLLKSMLRAMAPAHLATGFREELFQEVVGVLRDRITHKADKAALQVLALLCSWGSSNRIKAANAGAVPILVELLLDKPERRVCELVLVVLDRVCGCAEGRAELVGHAAGIAIVSKKILRVSEAASERGVKILNSVARFSATATVLQEMLQIGVVSKLCLVLQVDCGMKTKEKAKEILRLHSRVWKKSKCLSPQFLISYPSS